MNLHHLAPNLAVSPQVTLTDMAAIQAAGYRSIICNRPDDEGPGPDHPSFVDIERAAQGLGMVARYLPAPPGKVSDADGVAFARLMHELPKPVLAYCRTGMRSTTMWALAGASVRPLSQIVEKAKAAGHDLKGLLRRIANGGKTPVEVTESKHQIVIIGGGSAGIAAAASLLARDATLDIAIIDPADIHCYQPGWTLVGAGIFRPESTARTMASVMPRGVHWIKAAVVAFEPDRNSVILEGCRVVGYQQLIVCPGLELDWHGVEGLVETLGQNGVTSNYRYDLAPYTWELVQRLRGGKALFTQPAMPIKCAGAPQKAMYLSSDHWLRNDVLKHIQVEFYNSGMALFGVADYVPALMEYVKRYDIDLKFGHTLSAVNGPCVFRRT